MMTTGDLLLGAWDKDPFVAVLCAGGLAAYATARKGRLEARALYVFLAVVALVLALASPIAVLARGYLFSAHMLQHLTLVLVVPPLVLLGWPASAPSKPAATHDADGLPATRHPLRTLLPWLAGVGAMWIWHAPTLCDAAARSIGMQRMQSLSLLAMGASFWWPIFAPRARARLAPLGAMLYLFTACVGCTILGVIVTFSPVSVCSIYTNPVDTLGVLPLLRQGWGMTPKADQEIGGLMMWVPACVLYGAAMLAMLARYYREEEEELENATGEPAEDRA